MGKSVSVEARKATLADKVKETVDYANNLEDQLAAATAEADGLREQLASEARTRELLQTEIATLREVAETERARADHHLGRHIKLANTLASVSDLMIAEMRRDASEKSPGGHRKVALSDEQRGQLKTGLSDILTRAGNGAGEPQDYAP